MNPCPDLSTLDDVSFDEREAHFASCSACRMLFALRDGGGEAFGEECEMAETLVAVACDTKLNAIDQRRLARHLECCGRCSGLAGELLLLDGVAPVEELAQTRAWQPASAYASTAQPANDQRSRLFYGLGLAAAAAVILLIVLGMGASDDKEHSDSVSEVRPERQPKSLVSETLDPKVDAEEQSTMGASRPAPVLQAPPLLTLAELVEKSTEAVRNADYATAQKHCQAALQGDPVNQGAHLSCAIAACNLDDAEAARTHIESIKSSQRRQGLKQICLRLGVELAETRSASADDLADQATSLAIEKDYAGARKQCFKALRLDPDHETARALCAVAACNLDDAKEAQSHFNKLESAAPRSVVRQACRRLDIDVEVAVATKAEIAASVNELVERAEILTRNTQYRKGLSIASDVLERDPDNQRAITVAAIAACNLKKTKTASDYIARIKSPQRKEGLGIICQRFGVTQPTSDPAIKTTARPRKDSEPPVSELVEQAEAAVQSTQYGKGGRLCRQILERDPNNQRAITTCAIASCNLKNASAAKKYVRRVKSSQRRQGLRQICLRLGVTVAD